MVDQEGTGWRFSLFDSPYSSSRRLSHALEIRLYDQIFLLLEIGLRLAGRGSPRKSWLCRNRERLNRRIFTFSIGEAHDGSQSRRLRYSQSLFVKRPLRKIRGID